MTKKVRFLKDNIDIDLDIVVMECNVEEDVNITDDGIMFYRHNPIYGIKQSYFIPYSEESIYFEFID